MNKANSFNLIKNTFNYVKHDKLLLIFTLIMAFITSTSVILSSWFVGETLNLLIEYMKQGKLNNAQILNIAYASLITISLYFVFWISNSNIVFWSIKIGYRSGSRIRYAIFTKLLNVPISYIDKNKVGDLMSRATNDVNMTISNLVWFMFTFFSSPFLIIGSLITMFLISSLLSIITIFLMITIFLCTYIFAKSSSPNFATMQNKLADLNALNEEYLVNKLPIYMFRRQKYASNKFQNINKEHEKNTYKAEYKIGLVYPILDVLENIAYGVIYTIGFVFILLKTPHGGLNELNLGNLATFVVIARLANGEIANIARFGSVIEKLIVCLKRIYSFIDIENDINSGTLNIDNLNGDIEFKNISFGYIPNKKIIKNLNLYIKKGQKIAIVGPTGSGKTTLINLLMRFYEIDEGQILINGIDIKEIDKTCLRKYISIVLQETSLFSESILTNISYGHHGEIDKNKVIKSAKEVGSFHYISLLEKGFNTIIKDSSSISSGQAQLLALTRAHYSPSNILILDEATSNIDSKTEYDVQQGMIKLMKNKTTFIIAHRLSTIVNSDLIIVMKDGQIIEKGTHKELVRKRNGFYAQMYKNNTLENEE